MRWFLITVVVVSVTATSVVSAPSVDATVSGEDGRLAFVSDVSGVDQIYLFDRDSSSVEPVTAFRDDADPQGIGSVAWSPDGQSLAFSRQSRPGTYPFVAPTIWTIDADGMDLRYVTDGASPSWSPDGLSLAFSLGSVGVVNGLDTSVIVTLELETGRQAILTDPGTWVHPNNSYTTSDGRPAIGQGSMPGEGIEYGQQFNKGRVTWV